MRLNLLALYYSCLLVHKRIVWTKAKADSVQLRPKGAS